MSPTPSRRRLTNRNPRFWVPQGFSRWSRFRTAQIFSPWSRFRTAQIFSPWSRFRTAQIFSPWSRFRTAQVFSQWSRFWVPQGFSLGPHTLTRNGALAPGVCLPVPETQSTQAKAVRQTLRGPTPAIDPTAAAITAPPALRRHPEAQPKDPRIPSSGEPQASPTAASQTEARTHNTAARQNTAVSPSEARSRTTAVILSEARSAQSKDPCISSSGEPQARPNPVSQTEPRTQTPATAQKSAVILSNAKDPRIPSSGELQASHTTTIYAYTAWHSLAWLVFANAIGILLAAMLLFPTLNTLLDTWTYGRWMPVHLNIELYGWSSLPLLAFLFKVYAVERQPAAQWARPILWIWSTALAAGSLTWISGHSSGKLFLDWTGYSRVLFPLAIFAVWLLLTYAYIQSGKVHAAKLIGLALLLTVPILLYISASPTLYPPINPDTGGPTGASQLESTLVVIAILLLLPFGLTRRHPSRTRTITLSWAIFIAESLLCLGLGRADVSHHRPTQYISLASLLLWIPLIPAYFAAFHWHPNTRPWRLAFLCWWAVLVPTGWALFLPGILDHFKFTDGLVGHSLLAMAGFVTAVLIFTLVQLLGDDGWIFTAPWSFYLWNFSVLAYILLMFLAGWREGTQPSFTMTPGPERNLLYALRLLTGVLMFIASADWLLAASRLLREPQHSQPSTPEAA